MPVGLSLSPEILTGKSQKLQEKKLIDAFGGVHKFLDELKLMGIETIELRSVTPERDLFQVDEATGAVWSSGLRLSVHGKLTDTGCHGDFAGFYPSFGHMLQAYREYQDSLNVVVHGFTSTETKTERLRENTIDTLNRWLCIPGYGTLTISLEINRIKEGRNDPCTTCEGVLNTINAIRNDRLGICWDMGHFYYNVREGLVNGDIPQEFLDSVNHTHIHGLGDKGTHCSLLPNESLPLDEYLELIEKTGYDRIYNLEFTFEKFPEDSLIDELLGSIDKFMRVYHSVSIKR